MLRSELGLADRKLPEIKFIIIADKSKRSIKKLVAFGVESLVENQIMRRQSLLLCYSCESQDKEVSDQETAGHIKIIKAGYVPLKVYITIGYKGKICTISARC